MPITKVKIFPTIGIARLGNSPSEFFVGPEIPGKPADPGGSYRDDRCRMKRQAARFRLFGFDGNTLVKEITFPDATAISWTVHLANKKASWRRFIGSATSSTFRNDKVTDRASLEIDPGPRTIGAANQSTGFNTGSFLGKSVPLGEMRTESTGRLLVLSALGDSGSVPDGIDIVDYANNDRWYDDTSDGPVTATVTVDGSTFTAEPAWVICAPPDFAPPVGSVTTLYDVLFQVAVDKGFLSTPAKPLFTQHILPILVRTLNIGRTSKFAAPWHTDFDPTSAAAMGDSRRQTVFSYFRPPPNSPAVSGPKNMPKIWGDDNKADQVVTETQYAIMKKWTGTPGTDWEDDSANPPPAPTTVTPDGLTRAALEACSGGAFFPGIEASWFLRNTNRPAAFDYTEPFRLNHTGHGAGDVTKQMALPWQADYLLCRFGGGGTPGVDLAWWPAHRPDDVFPETGGGQKDWTREIIDPSLKTAKQWNQMVKRWHNFGIVGEKGGSLVETERRKGCRSLFMVTDRSHFSEDEVDALLSVGPPADFDNALYVMADDFTPAELGLSTYSPSAAQLAAAAPAIEIRRADDSLVPGMTADPQNVLFKSTTIALNVLQRVTFVYRVRFQHSTAFTQVTEPVTATATKSTFTATGALTLLKQPNPYMVDGQTHWLSMDLRVFQIKQGEKRFGEEMGADAAAATKFIKDLLTSFNAAPAANHPFDTISGDPQTSRLELSEKVGVKRVFNFAVARVRYRSLLLDAKNVRVFFRLFTTAATGLDYNSNDTYRRTLTSGQEISLLGIQGGKLVTIPCYAKQRVDTSSVSLATQTDPDNVRKIKATGAGETQVYFGCWLDFNQTTARFPTDPNPVDGHWPASQLKSIQELIRGTHQCLAAEIHFPDDPVPTGATPASNDNLAQRNLVIDESSNPGTIATRTVQHTLELKATTRPIPVAMLPEPDPELEEIAFATPGGTARPDEVMIRWHDLPTGTEMTLYMPDVDVDEGLQYAGSNYEHVALERIDAHTVRCLQGDVTFVPLPELRKRNIPGLLTISLPEGIKREQSYNVTVHQISGVTSSVLGSFQFHVPVSSASALLAPEQRKLSVLRHIALAIASDDPWHPVFERYLAQVADRVGGFGGNPDDVEPSPDGSGVDAKKRRCALLGGLLAALVALLVIIAGTGGLPGLLAQLIFAIAVVLVAVRWGRDCRPNWLQVLLFVGLGFGLGALLKLWLS